NTVHVSRRSATSFQISDTDAPLSSGQDCRPDAATVVCEPPDATGQIRSATVDLGDGDDSVVLDSLYGTIKGGPGDESLVADGAVFDGGPGADLMRARHAFGSTVSYASRTAPVRVTVDGVSDDGEPGEGDDV